jgi:hypothetical protein
MTDLNKLSVSLTKHGAHKLALLLRDFDKDHLIENLWGKVPGVNIETAQAAKNLSVDRNGVVPELWDSVRPLGNEAINGLVFVAVVFSHIALIEAMKNSTDRKPFRGTISRDKQLAGKAYTNFAHTVHELGFSSDNFYSDYIRFDVKKLFEIPGLHTLVAKLLTLKLAAAGWNKSNSLVDEAVLNNFHDVFSISKEQLSCWLTTGSLERSEAGSMSTEDLEFFTEAPDAPSKNKTPFAFTPGHNAKKTGKVSVAAPKGDSSADLLHNDIQNKLYAHLVGIYGKDCVRTELPTGEGTSIDVVVKTDAFCWFYEIKTASTVRTSVRQAIPQLLEYAYWTGDKHRADKLIIVSQLPPAPEADVYLKFLSTSFGLPLEYEQFDPNVH